jgi:hypothetical protein
LIAPTLFSSSELVLHALSRVLRQARRLVHSRFRLAKQCGTVPRRAAPRKRPSQ